MNAIEIHGLCKSYGDFRLDSLSLSLPMGSIMGLVGENGAGKSTTIKLILGMVKSEGGSITLRGLEGGEEIDLTLDDIGVVLDEVGIHGCMTPKSVDKIMKHTFKNWDSEVYFGYIKRFGLPKDKKYEEFSRGMKAKLGIAIALSHAPKLLILDEATTGLDPVIRDEMLDIFNEFTRDDTHSILISSHIVSDLEKICDYIAFIHKGRLTLCEEKDILYSSYGVLRVSPEELAGIPTSCIAGKKSGVYSTNILVRREGLPEGYTVFPCDIEQLFIFMTKEERAQ